MTIELQISGELLDQQTIDYAPNLLLPWQQRVDQRQTAVDLIVINYRIRYENFFHRRMPPQIWLVFQSKMNEPGFDEEDHRFAEDDEY